MITTLRGCRVFSTRNSFCRGIYTLTIEEPAKDAIRIAPYPFVWVSATDWDSKSALNPSSLKGFLQQGFVCIKVDIASPSAGLDASAVSLMQYYGSELTKALEVEKAGAAPIVCARNMATLIAQTYISSHPATALILHDPPACNADLYGPLARLPEFSYEPRFPIALVANQLKMDVLKARHRLGNDPNVDVFTYPHWEGAIVPLGEWLDECGI